MIALFLLLLIHIKTIDITLTSMMTDITTDNYKISNNIVSIKANGDYKFTGSCSECQISVGKGLTVDITLSSITIDNSNTGPFVIKKESIVNLILEGESSITDNEAEENEELDDFEGAGIKFKNSSSLTIKGTGKLNVVGNPKNGIKGAALSSLTINGGTLNISASKNALACDDLLTINDGTIIVTSKSDGIKSEPDSDDNDSRGTIIINGGTITVNSDSDAIQAGYKLLINGGNFNIKTLSGASTTNFDKDNDSAKGLKCSTNEHENVENELVINGGNFVMNTADDSIHSDYNLTITGGTFDIKSGDDGVHADQYLILGKQNSDNSLINLKVQQSLEGLEGAYVYIYSGTYNIISSDDGINSAGDTDENCQQQQGPNNNRSFRNLRGRQLQMANLKCSTFHIYIYGGDIYVNAVADGLDANGNVVITGGNIEIWAAKTGSDGDPIDRDGTLSISGATVLAGGNQQMSSVHQSSTINQYYIYTSQSFSANKQISIKNGETVVRSITIPKNVAYIFYTSKDANSNYKFSEGTTSNSDSNTNSQNPGQTQNNPGQFPGQNPNNGTFSNGPNPGQDPNNGTFQNGPNPSQNNPGQFPNNGTFQNGPNPSQNNPGQFPSNGTFQNGPNPSQNNPGQFPNNGTFQNGPNPSQNNPGQFPSNGTFQNGPNPSQNNPVQNPNGNSSSDDDNNNFVRFNFGINLEINHLYILYLIFIILI